MPGPPQFRGWFAAIIASALIGGGVARAQSAIPEAQLETFLGLNPPSGLNSGDLTNLGNGPVTSGSAIMQSISVASGATLTFDYNFLTNAPPPASNPLGAVDPFGFVTAPALSSFVDNFYGYPTTMASAPAQSGFLYQSGYQSFSETFSTAGTYSLGIGVANVTSDTDSSALLIDNITLTGGTITNGLFSSGDFSGFSTIGNTSIQTSAFGINPTNGKYQALISGASVPEPSSIVLLVAGSLGAAVVIRRCHTKSAASRGSDVA
jgi:hypothetical protein